MRKNNTFKTLIILLALGWSGVVLYPTLQLNQSQKRADAHYAEISKNVGLSDDDISAALLASDLELRVRDAFDSTSGANLNDLIEHVDKLVEIDEKIKVHEVNAIKLGLDLQGGTYLVYEVDLPNLLINVAKETSQDFESILYGIGSRVKKENLDFFDLLPQVFEQKGMSLDRYFGKRGASDADVISDLKDEAEDAVERTLEVLRNRIDQFGVSEPSITKQGSRRIVIELAGVKDVNRAKSIIGSTALLEFKLESEQSETSSILDDINRAMRRQMAKGEDYLESATDSSATAKVRKDTEISLGEAFGESSIFSGDKAVEEGDSPEDTTVLVDQEIFEERPFHALLANVGGDIGVPTKNVRTVERILNSPEVQDILPENTEFVFMNHPDQVGEQEYYRLYMLKREAELDGKMIATANVQIGSELQAGRSVVGMELTGEGGKIFSRVTGANVNKRLAIVLDGKIVSIPNITERIPSGRAQITGMANMDEAKDLAIQLRAGALPAPIEVIEERTVGPSLGKDSINKGKNSALAGFALVVIFMVIYYRMSGIVANVALFFNLIIILAVMAGFHATLTLPGVAGIILTIGMAVDANVLVFERIREELSSGKTVRAAIDGGYSRAFTTILDANVTTLLTALVLYQFGSGPIRGFALTLSVGILASMFTAIIVTRVIFDHFTSRATLKKLSI